MVLIQKFLLLLCLLVSSSFADKIEVSLREFASMVATQNKVNILIQESIDDEKATFMVGDKNNSIYLPAFKKMLFLKGFDFKEDKKNSFYFIEKIPEKVKEEKKEPEPIKDIFHSITLKNTVFPDVENLLKLYEAKYSYVSSTNTVAFFCKPEYLERIKKEIASLDVAFPQVQFKITVLETNLNDLKERGLNLSGYMQSGTVSDDKENQKTVSFNYFLNLITMPYTATTNVLENSKSGFYGVLRYLNQEGVTKILNSPVVTARSHSEASFSSGQNLPFLVGTNSYSNASTTTSNSYQYKDVGLKILIKPIIINDNINFDLTLTLEDILSGVETKTPITSKKELKSTYTLKKGELLVLSGINKETQLDNSFGVPILKDIFIVGELFKFESKSMLTSVISITIEVL